MDRQVQVLQVGLTEAVIQGDAQGLGGLGCVLGHVPGHLLSRQLPFVAGPR
jgi:hypothetical protein